MKVANARAYTLLLAAMTLFLLCHYYYLAPRSATNFEFFPRRQKFHELGPNASGICVYYNFTQAWGLRDAPVFIDNNSIYEPITLCLHTTINQAHYLWEHIAHWDDFISVSLLIRPGEEKCLARLIRAWRCYKLFREKVSLHLVWYRGAFQRECRGPDDLEQMTTEDEATFCDELLTDEDYSQPLRCGLYLPDLFYPYTRMHNIARRGAATQLHLVGDVDTAFSMHFAKRVRQLAQRHLMPSDNNSTLTAGQNKKVLVFRRFETGLKEGVQPPRTIEELEGLLNTGNATFFHGRFFPAGHFVPGLEAWLRHALTSPDEETRLTRLNYARYFPVDSQKNSYFEPQFISHASAPLIYEQTLGRYYTRQVLASELCRAGYKFWLLSHVFNVHPGMKLNRTILDTLYIQLNREGKASFHERYNAYLDEQYPRREECPFLPLDSKNL